MTLGHWRLARRRKWRACDVGDELILQPFRHFTNVIAHSQTLPSLYLRHSSFSNPSVPSRTSELILQPWAELILQPFRHFIYVTAHSPTLPLLHLRHSSFSNLSVTHLRYNLFSNPSVALPTSQLILQPFHCLTYVTAHSPTLSKAHSLTFLQLLCRFTYVRAHSPSFPSLHLGHSSFSNPFLALPTPQLILQPFRYFTYVTDHSPTLLPLLLCHRIFTYVTWRAAHVERQEAPVEYCTRRHMSYSTPSLKEIPQMRWNQSHGAVRMKVGQLCYDSLYTHLEYNVILTVRIK